MEGALFEGGRLLESIKKEKIIKNFKPNFP